MAGKESSRKPKPGSGLGRSWNPFGLILRGFPQPPWRPFQWASQIEPTVASAEGYSSHAIQKPPAPSAARADPWEYVEFGTSRMAPGGTEAGPAGNTATLIGEVTPPPVQDP